MPSSRHLKPSLTTGRCNKPTISSLVKLLVATPLFFQTWWRRRWRSGGSNKEPCGHFLSLGKYTNKMSKYTNEEVADDEDVDEG